MDSNLLSDNDYINMSTSAVRVRAPVDRDDEFKPLKRQKTKFVHNEEEELARQEKEDFDNNAGFFTKLFSEDKGILYDWAQALEPDDAKKLGDPDANKQALSQARQQLYERFDIPELDGTVDDLNETIDSIELKLAKRPVDK